MRSLYKKFVSFFIQKHDGANLGIQHLRRNNDNKIKDLIQIILRSNRLADFHQTVKLDGLLLHIFKEAGVFDNTADLFGNQSNKVDRTGRVFMNFFMLNIDNADGVIFVNNRDRKECLISILRQHIKILKPFIFISVLLYSDRFIFLSNPPRNSLSGFQVHFTQLFFVRRFGSHQNKPFLFIIKEINEDRIRFGCLRHNTNDFFENHGKVKFRICDLNDLAQNLKFLALANIQFIIFFFFRNHNYPILQSCIILSLLSYSVYVFWVWLSDLFSPKKPLKKAVLRIRVLVPAKIKAKILPLAIND